MKCRNKYKLTRVHRVFLTYSDKIVELINAGEIIVDYCKPQDVDDAEDITDAELQDEYDILETEIFKIICL